MTTTTDYVLDTVTALTMVVAETTTVDDGVNPPVVDPTIYYLHGLGLVAQSDGVNTEYFTRDGLGSVRQVADDTGLVLLAQTFDPYGNAYAQALDATWTGEANFGYTGEYTDANGLVFLRARFYDPTMGRFLNTDPSRQEMNPYQYALGNPVMYTDPSGEIVPLILGGLAIGIITALTYDIMVNQGKGGWQNVSTGNVFDPSHYCDIDWQQAAFYGAFGGIVGVPTALFGHIAWASIGQIPGAVSGLTNAVASRMPSAVASVLARAAYFEAVTIPAIRQIATNLVLRFGPAVPTILCTAIGLSTDAELPNCDYVPNIDLRIRKIDPETHWAGKYVALVQDAVRKGLALSREYDDRTRIRNRNWAFAIYHVDDGPKRLVWSVSGQPGGFMHDSVDQFLRNTGRRVASPELSGLFELNDAINQPHIHTEPRILEELLTEFEQLSPGQRVTIELYTERHPCLSCGGGRRIPWPDIHGRNTHTDVLWGTDGVIGQFAEQIQNMGIDLRLQILYSKEIR